MSNLNDLRSKLIELQKQQRDLEKQIESEELTVFKERSRDSICVNGNSIKLWISEKSVLESMPPIYETEWKSVNKELILPNQKEQVHFKIFVDGNLAIDQTVDGEYHEILNRCEFRLDGGFTAIFELKNNQLVFRGVLRRKTL